MRQSFNKLKMPFHLDTLKRKKHKETLHFRLNEWRAFAQLLEKGYPFAQCLKLMNYDDKKIVGLLQEGHTVESILISDRKGKFYDLLNFFVSITSLHDAIFSALKMHDFEKNIRNNIIKRTAYPLFILVFSFVTIYIFSDYIIPQLLENFESGESGLFLFIVFIKNGIAYIVASGIAIGVIGLLFQMYHPLKLKLFKRFGPYIGVLKSIHSYYLSCYLAELFRLGLSTKQSFAFLQNTSNKKTLHFVICDIYEQLQMGGDLSLIVRDSRYLNGAFKLHYAIGSSTNEYLSILEDFRSYQEERWFKRIKHVGLIIQLISYTLVGILIICVYQIMLIPLQMLENM